MEYYLVMFVMALYIVDLYIRYTKLDNSVELLKKIYVDSNKDNNKEVETDLVYQTIITLNKDFRIPTFLPSVYVLYIDDYKLESVLCNKLNSIYKDKDNKLFSIKDLKINVLLDLNTDYVTDPRMRTVYRHLTSNNIIEDENFYMLTSTGYTSLSKSNIPNLDKIIGKSLKHK